MLLLRRYLSLLMLIAVACALSACAEKEPEPTGPPPPPPPTPEEIAAKIITDAGLNNPLPAEGASFPREEAEKLKRVLRSARSANSDTPDGQRALQIVNQQLDQRLRALEGARAWEHVMGHIEGFELLNPGSPKWQTSKELAVAELRKPKVTIVGFMQDTAILEFYLPATRETHKERIRPGEEMYGVTLVEVIGNNQGVRLRYGETGQNFDILTKSAQR